MTLRHFLTSVGINEIRASKEIYTPQGLFAFKDGGPMIDAAIDNFDQNEGTLDGKSTTHAIAMVIYQRCDKKVSLNPIPRCSQRALDAQDTDSTITIYHKPSMHPEPAPVQDCDVPVAHKNTPEYKLAKETDLVWRLVHFVQSKTAVPG